MRVFIFQFLLSVLSVLASSQDDTQAKIVACIEAGDLEQVKALLSPSQVEEIHSDEKSMECSSDDSPRPNKKRKLGNHALSPNFDENKALFSAVIYDRTEIVKYLMTFPEVRDTADLPELLALAIDSHYNGPTLELLDYASAAEFSTAFIQAVQVNNLDLVMRTIEDDKLDLNAIMLVCISNMTFHQDRHEMIRFFLTHPKAKAIKCARTGLLNWAVRNMDFSIYLLYVEMYGIDASCRDVLRQAFIDTNMVFVNLMIAHPNNDLAKMKSDMLNEVCNYTKIIENMTWFLDSSMDYLKSVSSQFKAFRPYIKGNVLTAACMRDDLPKVQLLLDLGSEIVLPNYAVGALFALITMNLPEIFRAIASKSELFGDRFTDVMDFCMIEFNLRGNVAGILMVLEALQKHDPALWVTRLSIAEGETEKTIESMTEEAKVFQNTNMRGNAALLRLLSSHLVAMQAISEHSYLPQDVQDMILIKSLGDLDAYYVAPK